MWGIGQVFSNFSLIGFFKFGLAAVTRHEALAREPQVEEHFKCFNGIQWADPESAFPFAKVREARREKM
jgi:hypothetical protein